jgi:hypothetical protein
VMKIYPYYSHYSRFIDNQLGRLTSTPELPRSDRMNLGRRLWSLRINCPHAIGCRGGFSPPMSMIQAMGRGKPAPTVQGIHQRRFHEGET